jgi:uncharacterized protein YndB with AHSA1/START domain
MIDVAQQINAVKREVGARALEAGEARVVTVSQTYDTDVEDLWDACTNAERLPRWFLPVSGDLRVGGRYQLEGNAGGTVERCDPPRTFSATWEFGGQVSWIDVRVLPAQEGGARLELDHVAHVADDLWDTYGPGATGVGWDSALWGLANHLAANGATVDPAEVQAWSTSPAGVGFMTDSSDRWRAASVASGTDEVAAKAAADRTTAFYTGQPDPTAAPK